MSDTVQRLANFVVDTTYEDLPANVVHSTKYFLLDSIGCGLASVTTDRGKMSIAMAKKMGGPPESSIIGAGDKVSNVSAVFANGELINSADYDALIMPGGHVPPYVVPPALAVAESREVTGKDLLLATALAIEIAVRVPAGIRKDSYSGQGKDATFSWGKRAGQAYSNFGAAAGAAKLLGLDREQMAQALGISGHLCQVLTHVRYSFSDYRHHTKYGVPGWQNTGGMMAAQLAEMGYMGDRTVFDGDFGFFTFCGYEGEVDLQTITKDIGKTWTFMKIGYKKYPCCRMLHGAIDCLYKVINEHDIRPKEIEHIEAMGHPSIELPCFLHKEVENVVDAQFNAAYVFSIVANGVRIGPAWHDHATMHDPKIRDFMKRVTFHGHPEFIERNRQDPSMQISSVDVVARGQTFHEETLQPSGITGTKGAMSDAEMEGKFRHNAERVLTQTKINAAVDALLNLETLDNASDLVKEITL